MSEYPNEYRPVPDPSQAKQTPGPNDTGSPAKYAEPQSFHYKKDKDPTVDLCKTVVRYYVKQSSDSFEEQLDNDPRILRGNGVERDL